MRIVYIAREPNIDSLFLPIAKAFRKLLPEARNILVDPSRLFQSELREGVGTPIELFKKNGFEGIRIDPSDYKNLINLSFKYKFYLFYLLLFKKIKPSVVIVPHEYGHSFLAVQTAKMMGIPTYHIQHGIWGPQKLKKSKKTKYLALPLFKKQFFLNNSIGVPTPSLNSD